MILGDWMAAAEAEVDSLTETVRRLTLENGILQARIAQLEAEHACVERARLDAANAQGAQARAEQELEHWKDLYYEDV